MTRINCVPPDELVHKHLVAEYRELPRVFKLAEAAWQRDESPTDSRNPAKYILGTGHVRFFYPRLTYLASRHKMLVEEMSKRGYRTKSFEDVDWGYEYGHLPDAWWQDWIPTPEALALNRARIAERLKKM